MIETKVPKDIRVYETKIIGPFTIRQAVCFLLLVVLDILIYSFVITPLEIPADYSIYLLCLVDLPIAAFGFVKIMDAPLEKYLGMILISSVLSPSKRKAEKKIISQKAKKKKKVTARERKRHPEYRAFR